MVASKTGPIEATAKITGKGQITLPKAVRDRLGLKPGDEVRFVEDKTGIQVKRPVRKSQLDKWEGYLARTNPIDMSDEEYIALARGRDNYRY
jgi:AbrB family looped-hinge helix DNA binding protein